MNGIVIQIVISVIGKIPKSLASGGGGRRIWNKRTDRDDPNYSIVKIG